MRDLSGSPVGREILRETRQLCVCAGEPRGPVALCRRRSWVRAWWHVWLGQRPPDSRRVPPHPSVASRAGPATETGVSRDPRQVRGGEADLRASREGCPWVVARVQIRTARGWEPTLSAAVTWREGSPYWCCVSSSLQRAEPRLGTCSATESCHWVRAAQLWGGGSTKLQAQTVFCFDKANTTTSVNNCLQCCVHSLHNFGSERKGCIEVCTPEKTNISSLSRDNVQLSCRVLTAET